MKLIVLDFSKGIAYVYTLADTLTETDIEEYISERHSINNCQWMLTKNEIIEK